MRNPIYIYCALLMTAPAAAIQDEGGQEETVQEDVAQETDAPQTMEEKLEDLRQMMADKKHAEVIEAATGLIDTGDLNERNLHYAHYLRGIARMTTGDRDAAMEDLKLARKVPAFRSWAAVYSLDYHADKEDWKAVAGDILSALAPPATAAKNIRNRTVFWVVRELKKQGDRDALKGFLAGLWSLDFRGESRAESVEILWFELARLRAEDGDMFNAARAIKRVSSFELALAAVQDRRLEDLMGRSDVAHWFAPERIASRSIQASRARANNARKDFYAHAALINELRTFGLMEEAAAVVADVEARFDEMDARNNGDLWFMNVAALLAAYQGDNDKAIAWFERSLSEGLEERPESVSQLINFGMFLWNRGYDERAREVADQLLGEGMDKLSDYGRYLVYSMDQCIAAHAGQAPSVNDGLEKMNAIKVLDTRVYTLTLMCNGRDEEAAAHLIARLSDPEQAMSAAQLYVKSRGMHEMSGRERGYHKRIKSMTARADVKAAFDAVARPFELDAWLTYWGVY